MSEQELLEKFFSNKANKQEAEEAIRLLGQKPELLEHWMSEAEWYAINDTAQIPAHLEANLDKQAQRISKPRILQFIKPIAVAASLALLLALGFYLRNETPVQIAETPAVPVHINKPLVHENHSGVNKEIQLPDGSAVTLLPQSKITLATNFETNRSITLQGQAIFTVIKNKDNPFSVISGQISTTALGTKFLVDEKSKLIQLFEGKVVVKSNTTALTINDVFLVAGQQVTIDIHTMTARVSNIYRKIPRQIIANKIPGEIPEPAVVNEIAELEFYQAPLSEVVTKLNRRYGKNVDVDSSLLAGKYFTGSFSGNETFETILGLALKMNQLKLDSSISGLKIIQENKPGKTLEENLPELNQRPEMLPVPEKMINPDFSDSRVSALLDESIMIAPGGATFKRTALENVFAYFSLFINSEIRYNNEEISGLYFSGTIPAGEKLEDWLPVICRMNGLNIEKSGDTIIIRKIKQPISGITKN